MPEHGEAQKAPADIRAEALGKKLRHHRAEPQEPHRDMHAVTADQREEAGKKSAARRAVTLRIQGCKFRNFQKYKGEPEQPRDDEPDLCPELAALCDRDARHAAEEARSEQTGGFQPNAVQIENLFG